MLALRGEIPIRSNGTPQSVDQAEWSKLLSFTCDSLRSLVLQVIYELSIRLKGDVSTLIEIGNFNFDLTTQGL